MYKIIGADQKEYGPVSAEQLRQWINEGRINGQTKVLAEGASEWQTLAQFPEFGLTPSQAAPQASAPGVVKVFAVLNIIFGGLGILCSPFTFLALRLSSRVYGQSPIMMKWLVLSGFLSLAGAVLMLISGVGLWQRKAWARKLAVYYAGFAVMITLASTVLTVSFFSSNSSLDQMQRFSGLIGAVVGAAVGILYNALLIFFLTRSNVRQALGGPTA